MTYRAFHVGMVTLLLVALWERIHLYVLCALLGIIPATVMRAARMRAVHRVHLDTPLRVLALQAPVRLLVLFVHGAMRVRA